MNKKHIIAACLIALIALLLTSYQTALAHETLPWAIMKSRSAG